MQPEMVFKICEGISCSSFSVQEYDVIVHNKVVSLYMYNHIKFMFILCPTSLANLATEVGTRHSHQILLYEITLLVPPFCLTAGGSLSQCQYKTPGNIQKTSRDPLTNIYGWPSLLSCPGQPSSSGMLISPIAPKGSVTHLCWSRLVVSRHCMQVTSETKVAIMPTNIWSVIIVNIVWLSGHGLSLIEMSRITGVSQGAI